MTNIFEDGKFTKTTEITTYFNGWQLPEKERKLLIDFAEEGSGSCIFSNYIYDVGTRIDVMAAIEYGCDEEEYEEGEYSRLKISEVKAILEKAFEAGVDVITFYK